MTSVAHKAVVTPVRFEHGDVILGVGTPSPRLSWQVRTEDRTWSQTAYEVELDGTDVVRVESAEQVLVPWPFEPLRSRQQASVRVRVASGDVWSAWSEAALVEAGLLATDDWTARFISPRTIGGMDDPAPILSRAFTLKPGVRSARLYITAHGVYEASINGQRVGDDVLAPGWTSYSKRLRYQVHDVTSLLREGGNNTDVLLGNGWFRGGPARISGENGPSSVYGNRLALLAQLEITYSDGSVQVIGTDGDWQARESNVLANDLYDGQRIDCRPSGANVADMVDVLDEDLERLVAAAEPPVRVTETVPATTVWTSPSGATLVDFGQNLVGWVRLRVRNAVAGNEIVVRHAEVLEDGELCVRALGRAKATDSYVLGDAEELVLEPSLTFHGFRYAEITGIDVIDESDVNAVVIGSDLVRTGWFSCSDPDLERLHENVVWSMRGNFLSVPTDCPQRSERLGWTGDIQVFAPTASFLFNAASFLGSWLQDLAADQDPDGAVPHVVPAVIDVADSLATTRCATGWGDAATVVPWVLYQRFGDVDILRRQFDSMRAWVDKVASLTADGVRTGGLQYGDWLDPSSSRDNPFAAKVDPDVVATAYLARSADILSEAARVLGKPEESQRYGALAKRTRHAFAHAFVTGQGRVSSDAPAAYALAIEWALLPSEEQRAFASERLGDLVRANGFRVNTGFLSTPLMCDALCSAGNPRLAYRLLLEKECPSWLYPVTVGATTIWESWDTLSPDGSVNPSARALSFNHYALGAVADWLHRTVAGLSPAAPGYREITVHPIPDSALTHASVRHDTPYGEAAVAWYRENGTFRLEVTIPVGTEATVHLPGQEPKMVGHGTHSWTTADPCVDTNGTVSTARELLDSPELWPQVASAVVESGFYKNTVAVAQSFVRNADRPALEAIPGSQELGDLRRSVEKILANERPV